MYEIIKEQFKSGKALTQNKYYSVVRRDLWPKFHNELSLRVLIGSSRCNGGYNSRYPEKRNETFSYVHLSKNCP